MIRSDRFTPVIATLIPTGELQPVQGAPFDLNTPTPLRAGIVQREEQPQFANGYDHNRIISTAPGELELMARVAGPTTGRVLEVFLLNWRCGFTA